MTRLSVTFLVAGALSLAATQAEAQDVPRLEGASLSSGLASAPDLASGLITSGFPTPPRLTLGALVGLGYLGAPGYDGADITAGLRYLPIDQLALSFDIGWGVMGGSVDVQDRWWLIPSLALVVPMGSFSVDFGLGMGLGTSSGYASWAKFFEGPFNPEWAYQLVPVVRGHILVTAQVYEWMWLFVRGDTAKLLVQGNSIGSRNPNPNPIPADFVWFELALGVQFRLL